MIGTGSSRHHLSRPEDMLLHTPTRIAWTILAIIAVPFLIAIGCIIAPIIAAVNR